MLDTDHWLVLLWWGLAFGVRHLLQLGKQPRQLDILDLKNKSLKKQIPQVVALPP